MGDSSVKAQPASRIAAQARRRRRAPGSGKHGAGVGGLDGGRDVGDMVVQDVHWQHASLTLYRVRCRGVAPGDRCVVRRLLRSAARLWRPVLGLGC